MYAVTIECVYCYVRKKARCQCLLLSITERMDIGLYEMPLSMSLLDFGKGTMIANFHMCGITLWLAV